MKAKLIKTAKLYALKTDDIIATNDDYFSTKLEHPYRLSTKNCQAIKRGYDLDELADEYYNKLEVIPYKSNGFKSGFQKALEILGDKKFSEEDVIKAMNQFSNTMKSVDKIFQSLQQTQWDVEILTDRIPADLAPGGWDVFPKLDAENCLILKRVK